MDTTQQRTKLLFSKLNRTCKDLLRNPVAEKVHQFRTTLRRIESAIGAGSTTLTPKEKRLLDQLSKIRKRAGKLRDIDVQLTALASLSVDRGFDHKKQVQQALEQKRMRRADRLTKSLTEFSESLPKVTRLGKKIVASESKGADDLDFNRLAMDHWSQAAAKHELTSKRQIAPETLHDFRLDLKRVRYTAEMAGQDGNATLISQAKRIQDAIGEWRDWATLADTAEKELRILHSSSLVSLLKNVTGAKFLTAIRTSIDVTSEVLSEGPPKKSPKSAQLARLDNKKISQR